MRWLDQCRWWVKEYDPVRPEHLTYKDSSVPYTGQAEQDDLSPDCHHYAFMRVLSQKLPANAIIVSDTGGNVIMMGHCFQSKAGQRIFTSNGNTPMGFAMCGAIGAWFAEPTRPVICIIGDGGMQLNIQELQTIKHYKIPLKVFIVNNKILGNTKSYQRVNKKAELACGPDGYSSPDFSAVANAYGLFAMHIDLHVGAYWVIDNALEMEEAVIVDVLHEDFCTYEPRMSRWDAAIEEMYPPLPKDEFLKNMYIKPLPGWGKRR